MEQGRVEVGSHETVRQLGDGLWQIDLDFQGLRGVIAAYLLAGGGELALIETGPSSTLPTLRAGIAEAGFSPADLTTLLVTHIHLDHSGAAGPLLREAPNATVRVHPIGAPHLVDPARLVASATRIYGDRMDELWGEIAPAPAERVVAMEDGETLSVAGRVLSAVFTPGHASHHVAFWDPASGTAFTGDAAGVRVEGSDYVCPPTPPPDLDPEAWAVSIQRMRDLSARRLCLTHFGTFENVETHWDQLEQNLRGFLEMGEQAHQEGAEQAVLTDRLHDRVARELNGSAVMLDRLEAATPSYMAAMGLTRWAMKRERG
jgi:glyoxylase-like metal-dependent hydrolase (beta-lactamase superfamily II)